MVPGVWNYFCLKYNYSLKNKRIFLLFYDVMKGQLHKVAF